MPWVGQAAECGGGNNTYMKNLSKEEGFTKKSLSLKNVLYCFTPNTASSWIWIYAYHYQGLLWLDYCKWALLRQTMARLSTVIWSWNKHFETSVLEVKYGIKLGYWLQLRGRGKTQKLHFTSRAAARSYFSVGFLFFTFLIFWLILSQAFNLRCHRGWWP